MGQPFNGARTTGVARLQIGELARRTGCNIETIRFYEKTGVLAHPVRTEGGFRLYGAEDVRRLSFIRRARELGFSLDEVRAMLRLSDEQGQPCADIREVAAAHLADVRSKIADLRSMEAALASLIAQCADGTPSGCPLIETLADMDHGQRGRLPANGAGGH
jgi:MerR family mercuric resistance operon transcriptional regulator